MNDEGTPLLNLLHAFQRVKKEVFGRNLGEMWEDALDDFSANLIQAHDTVGLSVTPKLHILHFHVREFVALNNGQGLGRLNESAVEAIHSTFIKIWNMYKVNDVNSPVYLEHLLKAVTRANADNTKKCLQSADE